MHSNNFVQELYRTEFGRNLLLGDYVAAQIANR